MNKRFLILFLAITTLFAGCKNNYDNSTYTDSETGSIKIEFNNPDNCIYSYRTLGENPVGLITPDNLKPEDIAKIELYLDGAKKPFKTWVTTIDPEDEDNSVYAFDLMFNDDTIITSTGMHIFTIFLYNLPTADVPESTVIAQADCVITVLPQDGNLLSFEAKLPPSGYGYFEYRIFWHDEGKIKKVKMGLFTDNTHENAVEGYEYAERPICNVPEENLEDVKFANKYVSLKSPDKLEIGNYYLYWQSFSDDECTKEITNGFLIVEIEHGQFTSKYRILEPSDANYDYAITYNFCDDSKTPAAWKTDYIVPESRKFYDSVALPSSERFDRKEYTFYDWWVVYDPVTNSLLSEGTPNMSVTDYFQNHFESEFIVVNDLSQSNVIPCGYNKDITVFAKWLPNKITAEYITMHESKSTEAEIGISFYDSENSNSPVTLTDTQMHEELENPKYWWNFDTRAKVKYTQGITDEDELYTNYAPSYIAWYVDSKLQSSSSELRINPLNFGAGNHTVDVIMQIPVKSTLYDAGMEEEDYPSEMIHAAYNFGVYQTSWVIADIKDSGKFWGGEFSYKFKTTKYKFPAGITVDLIAYNSEVLTDKDDINDEIKYMYNDLHNTYNNVVSDYQFDDATDSFLPVTENKYAFYGCTDKNESMEDRMIYGYTGWKTPFYIDMENGYLYLTETTYSANELMSKFNDQINVPAPELIQVVIKFSDGTKFSINSCRVGN